jgi:hypothetical protein
MISATPLKFAIWPNTPVKLPLSFEVVNFRLLVGQCVHVARAANTASLPVLLVARWVLSALLGAGSGAPERPPYMLEIEGSDAPVTRHGVESHHSTSRQAVATKRAKRVNG